MSSDSLPIIAKSYELYKQIVEINSNVQKRWRYGICVILEKTILEFISNLITANSAPKTHRQLYLLKANAQLEIIMLHVRIYMEFKITNQTKLYQIQSLTQEIGRMLGGWIKANNF
ncbi:MAG: four helix bundle protein [Candidatus Magasanikbacteria bacterium]|nr:four helix bundle protein [Candidatus Magasanikbacteria bacterium]